jgi:hypothetical protein
MGSVVPGTPVELGTDPFPSISGWTYESSNTSGGVTHTIYSRMTYVGSDDDGSEYLRETMHFYEDPGPPVDRSYRIDSQTYIGLAHQQVELFIYRIGSGNAELDELVEEGSSMGEFFPFLPVRVNNVFLSESYHPEAYEQVRKAYKKATGSKITDFIDKLEDNPDLGDIDYAYVAFGVSLNVAENSCKRYLYKFFEKLQQSQIGGPNSYDIWKAAVQSQDDAFLTWKTWKAAQTDSESPLFGTAEPPRPGLSGSSMNTVRIAGTSPDIDTNYDTRINWFYIDNDGGTGQGRPGAKRGDLWFETLAPDEFVAGVYGSEDLGFSETSGFSIDRVRLYWQKTSTSFTYLDLVGLHHMNFIYGAMNVSVTAAEALADTDESKFIVPLHYETWRETELIHASQMGTACVFVVFNCYKIKKQKWYETGVFQIIIIIIIAILSVIFTGGAGLGLLGAHMAVGAALGLTGITAAIVGSIANAFVALVLVTILQEVAGAIFGPEIGAVVAAVAMFVIGSTAGSFHSTGSLVLDWGTLMRAENLLSITSSLGQGYAAAINAGTVKLGARMQDFVDNAKAEAEKIQQAYFEQFGYGAGKIDPMMLVDSTSASRILAESSDSFLTRTLMTGSEIAEMSRDLLYNFAEYSTKLPDAYT